MYGREGYDVCQHIALLIYRHGWQACPGKSETFVAVSESDEVWDCPYHPHILHTKWR